MEFINYNLRRKIMSRKKFLVWTSVLLLLSVMSLAFAQSPASDLTTPQMSEKMKNAIERGEIRAIGSVTR